MNRLTNEIDALNRRINIASLEQSLDEFHAMRRREKANLLNADASGKDKIEAFIGRLNVLISKTEERINALSS